VIVLVFGLFFGWYLSSSRLVLSLFVLALADGAVVFSSPLDGDPTVSRDVIVSSVALLVPLNLMAFALIKEEAIATWRGVLRLAIILLQPSTVWWLSQPDQAGLAQSLLRPVLPIVPAGWTTVPQLALLAYAGAVLLIGVRFVMACNPLDSGTLWTLIASFLAIEGMRYGWSPTNFFSTAGLILFVTLVQSSHRRAYSDELTGLPGKPAYDEAVAGLGARYVLAVIGVDQLKQYGNLRGKSVSDQVLRLLAPKITAAIGSGKVFRLTGEEFVVLFPRKTATATLVDLGVVRKSVEATELYLGRRDRVWEGGRRPGTRSRNERLPATVSIGLADVGEGRSTLALVTKAAYRALYEAKGEGGNRVKRATVSADAQTAEPAFTGEILPYNEFQG
jgi:GGDEF domain-containing protein